mmetsp:Transcript_8948/g.19472  ORF Transcript_8948/g.19472 Transcript_8948/m.19472 type:complete len:100 (+) Transcript_8948:488-787(+)
MDGVGTSVVSETGTSVSRDRAAAAAIAVRCLPATRDLDSASLAIEKLLTGGSSFAEGSRGGFEVVERLLGLLRCLLLSSLRSDWASLHTTMEPTGRFKL